LSAVDLFDLDLSSADGRNHASACFKFAKRRNAGRNLKFRSQGVEMFLYSSKLPLRLMGKTLDTREGVTVCSWDTFARDCWKRTRLEVITETADGKELCFVDFARMYDYLAPYFTCFLISMRCPWFGVFKVLPRPVCFYFILFKS